MVGATLDDIRRYVESLASDSGAFFLVCGRTGERLVPALGLTFETRATARAAAGATEQYRATLRQYDPQLPYYDVIVCQRLPTGYPSGETDAIPGDGLDGAEPGRSIGADASTDPSIIDFCHTVAGAIFEAVSASTHVDVERAIMDTYFHVAESTPHPDELCITLVESMATELKAALEPAEQLDILQAAARRLPSRQSGESPLNSTLSRLQTVTALSAYTLEPTQTSDPEAGPWTVTLEQYAFSNSVDNLVTLPLGFELLRRQPHGCLSISSVERLSDQSGTWRLVVSPTEQSSARGLVHATLGCER